MIGLSGNVVVKGMLSRNRIQSNGWELGRCFDLSSTPELVDLIPVNHKGDDTTFITVTHSCSLLHPGLDREPYLEYVAAKPIAVLNAQNSEAKDIRCLHLPLLVDGKQEYFELQMARRGFVDRSPLERSVPSDRFLLPVESKAILVRWLSNWYKTQTLPDAFDRRIKPLVEGKKKPLRKLLQKAEATEMLGIYIDLEPPHEDLEKDQSYRLTVLLLYKDEAFDGTYKLQEYAEQVKMCFSKAEGVDVLDVVALSDKDISVYRLRRMRRWQLDYISSRDAGDDVALIEDDFS